MYTDTAPVAGPSKRSYAQVLKDIPPPRKELNTSIINVPQDCADDWTDVSTVSSCDWPESVDEESVSTDEQRTPIRDQQDEQQYYPNPETITSVPWVDDGVDTRASHAMASHIKYTNRSRWRYTNIIVSPGLEGCEKPWRRYPGTRNAFVDNYQRQELRKNSKAVFLRETREAVKFGG